MNSASEATALISAYRAAHYGVRLRGGRRVSLHVGAACPRELAEMLTGEQANIGALITAWNPFSLPVPRRDNRRRQRELLDCLLTLNAHVLAGVGGGADWREPALAAFGVPLGALDALARRFAQNAILTFSVAAPVRLRLYRADWRDAAGADVDFAPSVSS